MSRVKVGDIYGRLTVLELIPDRKNPRALCRCECGKECRPQRGAIVSGKAKSCGCLGRENRIASVRKHGKSGSPEYRIFHAMKRRCSDPKNRHYHNYGARGIQVKWASFDAFFEDMGNRPDGAWIERIDNNGHYESGNCTWVTPDRNQINKRVSKIWTINGVEYESSTSAAKSLGVTPSVIIRGCNGYTRHGKEHRPREGWTCRLKYGVQLMERGLIGVTK